MNIHTDGRSFPTFYPPLLQFEGIIPKCELISERLLTGLQLSNLKLDAGSGAVDLTLPSTSTFEAEIDSGSGRVAITLPESVGARVELDSGSGSFRPDERFELVRGEHDGDGAWETYNFGTADHTVVLIIDQGSGSVVIR